MSAHGGIAEVARDPVIGQGGEPDLLDLDPLVPGVGLGDVAGPEDDAGGAGGVQGAGIGAEGDAQDLRPAAGRGGDGAAQGFEPFRRPGGQGRHVHPGLTELDRLGAFRRPGRAGS